jgi:hypothetical protein
VVGAKVEKPRKVIPSRRLRDDPGQFGAGFGGDAGLRPLVIPDPTAPPGRGIARRRVAAFVLCRDLAAASPVVSSGRSLATLTTSSPTR